MANQESSMAASSSLTPNWWDLHPTTSLSSSFDVDHVASIAHPSFTSASNRSTDASHDQLTGEDLSDNHIWRHVFSSVGDKYGSSMHNINEDNMLEPACNYLKQLETWEFTQSPSFNNVGQSNHFTNNNSELFTNNNSFKVENECHEMEQVLGYHYGMHNSSPRNNSSDSTCFSHRSSKPLIDDNIRATTRSLKSMSLFDGCKKPTQQINSPTGMDRGHTLHQGKKKRISEDNSETTLKKTKQDSSLTTNKLQVPKVKLGDKISALQQIVSPFGKTDTASVLYEAIGYIKFLQEQIQMLSNPYMKTTSHKGPWDWKNKGDPKHDLRSRGLCLVPISCTPQIYRENSGSEYWTPAYRGLYR